MSKDLAVPPNKKNVPRQLLREFWIPFLAASLWTAYVAWGHFTIKESMTAFGPSFFLASWLTGQFFRVRKQAGMETSLASVESRLVAVTKQLEHQANELTGHMTGGDSYPYFHLVIPTSSDCHWLLSTKEDSTYPMYGLRAHIVDLDIFDKTVGLGRSFEADKFLDIGDMAPGETRHMQKDFLDEGDSRNYNVFFNARNGSFTQQILLRRVEGHWLQASRVLSRRNFVGEVYLEVDDGFPLNADGQLPWDGVVSGNDDSNSPPHPSPPLPN